MRLKRKGGDYPAWVGITGVCQLHPVCCRSHEAAPGAGGRAVQKASGGDAASVRVVLDDGGEYALPGKLLFSDLTVDATTGQVTLRAEVPNPKGELLPGLYVRVRLEQAQVSDAFTVPTGRHAHPAG